MCIVWIEVEDNGKTRTVNKAVEVALLERERVEIEKLQRKVQRSFWLFYNFVLKIRIRLFGNPTKPYLFLYLLLYRELTTYLTRCENT